MSDYPSFDRDLSWLTFNYRVLSEAKSELVPLLERLRFLAIYSSNLDEFFRVRVASLRRLEEVSKKKIDKHLDFDASDTLKSIHDQVEPQLDEYGAALKEVLEALKEKGLHVHMGDHMDEHVDELRRYFKTHVLAYLQPKPIGDEIPFINNKALYQALIVDDQQVLLNIPSDNLDRFYSIIDGVQVHYYFIDDIIKMNTDIIFPDMEVKECCSFKLNKDADLQIDDEFSGNLVEKIEKQVKKRNLGVPTRFLIDSAMSKELLAVFQEKYGIQDDEISYGGHYHNLNDLFQIGNPLGFDIEYKKLPAVRNSEIEKRTCILDAIEEQDQILHFPYQSYDYVLEFFNEAAIHPEITEINVTFYRMAKNSVIGEALVSAAMNGKKVNVFMEVKARFDEENNLRWANRFKEAGVNIQYSMPGLKVHAKVALVKRESKEGVKFYGFFGTGNLNESTAKIYCDHGLLSSHPEMTRELSQVFEYLLNKKDPDSFKHLIVSQFGATRKFKDLIEREIEITQRGGQGHVIVKVNNLEEPKLINKLYEAAEAGVKVEVIARSICCLVPGTFGIEVSRVVDRYLEHARMFYFHNEGNPELYLGSSDWMKRNLRRRIEVSFPIYDEDIKKQLIHILNIQLKDTCKRVMLNEELENIYFEGDMRDPSTGAQINTYQYVESLNTIERVN